MMRALAILRFAPDPLLSQNALQQQPTSPNSGAGIPEQPGSKSGPAVKPPSATTTGSGVDSGPASAVAPRPTWTLGSYSGDSCDSRHLTMAALEQLRQG